MIVEAVGESFVYRWPGGEIRLEPGKPIELPDERAQRLLAKVPGKVRVVPPPLIRPGWLVTYRDRDGRLRGGSDERAVGTVSSCDENFVTLTTSEQVPLGRIVGVTSTNDSGGIRAAWLVDRHGLDGMASTNLPCEFENNGKENNS